MSSPVSSSGFGNAPVSKGIFLATVGASVFTQAAQASSRKLPVLLSYTPRALVLQHPAELLFGAFLLYHFRNLERQAGSRKFAAFAAGVTGVAFLLQAAVQRLPALILSGARGAAVASHNMPIVSGPYGLLFASFVQYFFNVPLTSKFSLFGWQLSDKSFIYLAGAQLLFSNGRTSILAGAAGLVAGLLYRADFLGLKRFRFPAVVSRLASRALGPLLQDSRLVGPQVLQPGGPLTRQQAQAPHRRAGQQHGQAGTAGQPAWLRDVPASALAGMSPEQRAQYFAEAASVPSMASASPQPPNEEAIAQLEAMGFDRARAVQALLQSGNDLQNAIAFLVT